MGVAPGTPATKLISDMLESFIVTEDACVDTEPMDSSKLPMAPTDINGENIPVFLSKFMKREGENTSSCRNPGAGDAKKFDVKPGEPKKDGKPCCAGVDACLEGRERRSTLGGGENRPVVNGGTMGVEVDTDGGADGPTLPAPEDVNAGCNGAAVKLTASVGRVAFPFAEPPLGAAALTGAAGGGVGNGIGTDVEPS